MKQWIQANWKFWTISLPLTFAIVFALTACGKKDDSTGAGRSVRAGKGIAVVDPVNVGRLNVTNMDALKRLVSAQLKMSDIGSLNMGGVEFSAYIVTRSDQMLSTFSNGDVASAVYLKIPDTNGDIEIAVTGKSGSLTRSGNGYAANFTFEDDYGTIKLTGTVTAQGLNSVFTGQVSFINKVTQDEAAYPLTSNPTVLGNFSIRACSIFYCGN